MQPAERPRWRPAYIGIGSNLESPERQVRSAIKEIDRLPDCALMLQSSLYRSAPMGPTDQPDFINAAVAILTTLDARTVLERLQRLERNHGRVRDGERWGPRTLDLDLLVFAGDIIDEPGLRVPHPGIAERNFVLLPLREIAPQLSIPGLGTVDGVAAQNDNSVPRIEKLPP